MLNKKLLITILLVAGVGITVVSGYFFDFWEADVFEVINRRNQDLASDQETNPAKQELSNGTSPFSGLSCKNAKQRPFAVILAGDKVVRPLSGLTTADLVLEIPVLTGSITRYIAIYVCSSPQEIGSLRSARHDFIPLAVGMDAILVHWGGSHYARDLLDAKVMDNIDALYNPFGAFWRKSEIPMPHNGFTSMERLLNATEKLGYRLESEFDGYPHTKVQSLKFKVQSSKSGILTIGYSYPYNVRYEYDSESNSYLRWRGGTKQIDKNNNKQLTAKVVVVMRAKSRQLEKDYNDLNIEGSGYAEVYQNGEVITGQWKKNGSSKLYFLDEEGEEIKFVPGQIWIQIVEPHQKVSWEAD